MELLDRYLYAVNKYLPLARQADILAELRANMEAQLEDKEAELGRPLTQGEVEEWLKKMGPPMVVAARYQPQRYLIGPTLFPIYWWVLRMAAAWAVIVYTVVLGIVVPVVAHEHLSLTVTLLRIPWVLFNTAAWVTAVFAALEWAAARYPEKVPALAGMGYGWNPGALPPVERTAADGRKPRSYAQAVAEIVFGFLALGWLLLVPQNPYLMFGPGVAVLKQMPYQLAGVWMVAYWWIIWLNVFQLGWKSVDFWRGAWQEPARAQHLLFKAFGLVPLVVLLQVRDQLYVTLKNPAEQFAQYGQTLDTINNSVHLGLMVVTAIAGIQLVWDAGQWAYAAYVKR